MRCGTNGGRALFAAGVDRWLTSGGAIGGRAATGHGRLRLDVHQWQHQTPVSTVGDALEVRGDPRADNVAAHREGIVVAVGWFA